MACCILMAASYHVRAPVSEYMHSASHARIPVYAQTFIKMLPTGKVSHKY